MKPHALNWLALACCLLAWLLCCVALSCRALRRVDVVALPTEAADLWEPVAPNRYESDATLLPELRAAFASLIDPPHRVIGIAKIVHGASVCATSLGVLPYVFQSYDEPRAGVEYRADFLTLVQGAPTDWPAVLIAGPRARADLTPLGLTGCWLLCEPAVWLWPGGDASNLVYRLPQDAGRIHLRWTPRPQDVGTTIVCQLVVFVPRNVAASGYLLSPGLELTVGSAP